MAQKPTSLKETEEGSHLFTHFFRLTIIWIHIGYMLKKDNVVKMGISHDQ